MIRTTILLYLIFLLLTLSTLRYLYLHCLERRNASSRQRVRFIRRSTALVITLHVYFLSGATLACGLYAALS